MHTTDNNKKKNIKKWIVSLISILTIISIFACNNQPQLKKLNIGDKIHYVDRHEYKEVDLFIELIKIMTKDGHYEIFNTTKWISYKKLHKYNIDYIGTYGGTKKLNIKVRDKIFPYTLYIIKPNWVVVTDNHVPNDSTKVKFIDSNYYIFANPYEIQ